MLLIDASCMQVLHCVMWPRRIFNLPILGFDIVMRGDHMAFFAFDATPTTTEAEAMFPTVYETMQSLHHQLLSGVTTSRMPENWVNVFSDQACLKRPASTFEGDGCVSYALKAARTYMLAALHTDPLNPYTEAGQDAIASVDEITRMCASLCCQCGCVI